MESHWYFWGLDSTDRDHCAMEFLGQWGRNKFIFKVMAPEMKKKYIIGDTFLNSTTYLAFHVSLWVWWTFLPPSYPAISYLSTDLDSLGQGKGFKTMYLQSDWTRKERKKNCWRDLFWFYYLPSISCRFVCLINFFIPFLSSYFKSKHRFGLLGPRRT